MQKVSVADMVANNDRLNWDSFTYLLPVQVIMVSAVSPPPSTDMKEDSMIKRHSPDGNFTVSSAYDVLRDMVIDTRYKFNADFSGKAEL
ncbi:hypothetical protein OIU76_013597 [Salix suchowensis]|uniref:Uncharacterized protein n=1 Tax=Salix suchowensis TaxID=1278906 RepID=A0ABQ9A2W3_9ROSI|nr:hypothetical protein OIU76_013597 [Salix suchowensis]KAJ6322295.1 hypothetical protein OIU77_012209 [Salix suchowensis]KAJ6350690.1 hypothetical protein OIU78_006766 [Salix suchowensis]